MTAVELSDGHSTVSRVRTNLLIYIWRPASGDRRYIVIDPGTETPLAGVADGTADDDALDALQAADRARQTCRETTSRGRANVLGAAFDEVTRRVDEPASVISLDMDKPLRSLHEYANIKYVAYAAPAPA